MRKPVLLKQAEQGRRQVSSTRSIPAPVKGLNALDSVASMNEEYAVIFKNWWPTTNDVQVRKGWDNHVTGLTAQVESLMPYVKPDGTETLFAAEGTDFFNVTSAGAVGAAVVTTLTNARWQSINFTNTSGTSYLCCFNGVDSPRYWDNSTWTTITGASSPAITGVTTSTLKAPWVHQRRIWTIETNSLSAWYLPVDAVGGAAKELKLSGLFKRGGHLIAGGSYTMDGGDGPDDYWYAITSEGEIVSYAGTDPSSLSTWRLVGVWYVGEPIGTRPLLKFRGDALIILREGVFPLSQALISAATDKSKAITHPIKELMANSARDHNTKFGWQIEFYPEANMIILNVPVQEGSNQEQYVMNVITGAWARFDNISANCWTIFNGQPYFGSNTTVGKLWGSNADNGNNINTDLQQAFSYFGSSGRLKYFELIKPYIFTDGSPTVLADINVDFRPESPTSQLTFTGATYGVWDTAVWDTSLWGGLLELNDEWQSCFGVGTSAALRMKTSSKNIEIRLKSTDYVYQNGGVVG